MSALKARHLWRLRYLEARVRWAEDELHGRRVGVVRAEEALAKRQQEVAVARRAIASAVSS